MLSFDMDKCFKIVLSKKNSCLKLRTKNLELRTNSGFTLIEMVIVLGIIAGLAASIVAGRAVVHSAKLTSVVTDIQHYRSAFNAFYIKYKAYPGDIDNATDYWPSPDFATLNGNRNGKIESGPDTSYGGTSVESLLFWQHLSLAGLIDGNYTGVWNVDDLPEIGMRKEDDIFGFISNSYASAPTYTGSPNMPASKFKGSGYMVAYETDIYGVYGNLIRFTGTWVLEEKNIPEVGVNSARNARAIDIKSDDGFAFSGDVLSIDSPALGADKCIKDPGSNDFTYEIEVTDDRQCLMFFAMVAK